MATSALIPEALAPAADAGPATRVSTSRGSLRGLSDEELCALGAAGVAALVERHHAALARYCTTLTRHPEDAADVLQSVWEQVLRTFSARPGSIRHVRAWLYRVARNECLDSGSSRRGRTAVDVDELELAGGPSPQERVEARAELEALLGDLRTLSERQRSALVLREFSGYAPEELASTLGTSPARALSLVAEARRSLTERRSGRALSCTTAQRELTVMRRRSARIEAHLASCGACQSFERRRRGRSLSSLALLPLTLLRGLARHAAALVTMPGDVAQATIATAVLAGSIAIVTGVPAHHAGGAPARPHGPQVASGAVAAHRSAPPVHRSPATRATGRPRRAATSAPRPRRHIAAVTHAGGAAGSAAAPRVVAAVPARPHTAPAPVRATAPAADLPIVPHAVAPVVDAVTTQVGDVATTVVAPVQATVSGLVNAAVSVLPPGLRPAP